MLQNECPHCHTAAVVPGFLESTGIVRFRPAQTRFLTFRTGDIAIRATMCPSCGHIDMVGDNEKLRLLSGTQARPNAQNADSPA